MSRFAEVTIIQGNTALKGLGDYLKELNAFLKTIRPDDIIDINHNYGTYQHPVCIITYYTYAPPAADN